jgi:hypothetical protein
MSFVAISAINECVQGPRRNEPEQGDKMDSPRVFFDPFCVELCGILFLSIYLAPCGLSRCDAFAFFLYTVVTLRRGRGRV